MKRGSWIAVAAVTVFFLACVAVAAWIDWNISYRSR